jgi:hypothetical protein
MNAFYQALEAFNNYAENRQNLPVEPVKEVVFAALVLNFLEEREAEVTILREIMAVLKEMEQLDKVVH